MNLKLKKGLLIAGVSVLSLVLVAGVTVTGVWFNEISTLSSFKKVAERNEEHGDGAVYRMDVKGDFYFQKFLDQGGASNDADLISFITSNITKGLIPMKISESEIGCSAFTCVSESGDRLFARNYDFDTTNTCLTFTNPKGRHRSFSTVDLQFLGMDTRSDVKGMMNRISCLAAPYAPLDGINDAGVSCGIFMSYQGEGDGAVATDQQTDAPDITSTTMLRMILDYAENVEEAVELVKRYDLHDSAQTSYHYMIADATGKSAILEWINGTDRTDNDGSARELVVTYNDDDRSVGQREGDADYQWITNFIIQPGYYENPEDRYGYDRYERIYERLEVSNGLVKDEEAAMEILAAVGRRTFDPDNPGITVHSVVYNLTKKTVYWIGNENYGAEKSIFHFSL